ncbi:hypothetical protein Lal_00022191 [Lupinus albus]|nr:hypothetical protein Lal_00022191 [Lupinus albus]
MGSGMIMLFLTPLNSGLGFEIRVRGWESINPTLTRLIVIPTHNVMQPHIDQFLQLLISSTPKFSIMVGNGKHIYCIRLRKTTPITFNSKCSILLSIYYLYKELMLYWISNEPVTSNFVIPSMTFTYDQKSITVSRQQHYNPTLTTFHRLKCPTHTDAIADIFCVTMTLS